MYENTVYIGLSRQMAMRRQMDVIANNLANMNTTAFKSERLLFEEYLVDGPDGRQMSFVQDVAIARDMRDGEVQPTANPFDVAIHGQGFFTVDTPDGPRYTRNGHLTPDPQGRLATREGLIVLSADGRPIEVPPGTRDVTVTGDGTISADKLTIGRLAVVTFDNVLALKPTGNGLFKADADPQPVPDAKVLQGMIEQSNVEPIVEMTNMVQVLRAYQANQQMLDTDSDLRRRAIRDLGKVA